MMKLNTTTNTARKERGNRSGKLLPLLPAAGDNHNTTSSKLQHWWNEELLQKGSAKHRKECFQKRLNNKWGNAGDVADKNFAELRNAMEEYMQWRKDSRRSIEELDKKRVPGMFTGYNLVAFRKSSSEDS